MYVQRFVSLESCVVLLFLLCSSRECVGWLGSGYSTPERKNTNFASSASFLVVVSDDKVTRNGSLPAVRKWREQTSLPHQRHKSKKANDKNRRRPWHARCKNAQVMPILLSFDRSHQRKDHKPQSTNNYI